MLPYMNCLELLVSIRERKVYENLPIIMLISNSREEDATHGFKAALTFTLLSHFARQKSPCG